MRNAFSDRVPAVLVLAVLLFSAPARADPRACGADGHPWVRLADEHASLDDAAWTEVTAQLRAALAARFIDLCTPTERADTGPLATLTMEPTAGDNVRMTVLVKDEVTDKRVARDLDLATTPVDGRPLMIALAADELLRASWAEVNLPGAPTPSRPVPREVSQAIALDAPRDRQPTRRRIFLVGLAAAAEHFTGGFDHAGADASVRALLHPRFGFELSAGLRSAFVRDAPDGRVRGSAVVVGGGPLARLVASPRLSLDVSARFEVTAARFAGDAHAGARHYEVAGTALHIVFGPALMVEIATPLFVFAGVAAGFPVRGVVITDGSERVGGISGVMVATTLGLGASL